MQFAGEVVAQVDQWKVPQGQACGILDFILAQPSIRDSFRSSTITKSDVSTLVDKLLQSLGDPANKESRDSKEVLVRFVAHVCFCKGDIVPNAQLEKIIRVNGSFLTKPPKAAPDAERPAQQDHQKLVKAALNCISNIYNRDNPQ